MPPPPPLRNRKESRSGLGSHPGKLYHFVLLGQEPLEFRLIDQIVGLLLVGEKVEREPARGGYEFGGFFHGHIGLPENIQDQVNDQLEAADLSIFFEDFGLAGHRLLTAFGAKTTHPVALKTIISWKEVA